MRGNDTEQPARDAGKRTWTPPTLKYVGNVGDVLQSGGGKLTPMPGDPGEARKPPGGGS